MSAMSKNRSQGFTLVELMIVVAIIGILSAVAIPSFINYQLNSKRVEAYANLASLGKAQKAYFAEYGVFVAAQAEPLVTTGTVAGATKRNSAAIGVANFLVGWEPEGDVFFDYDTATGTNPLLGNCGACTQNCFTSSAYGDLDGDGLFSILINAHPDLAGQFCTTGLVAGGGPYLPPLDSNGVRMLDTVARVTGADDF